MTQAHKTYFLSDLHLQEKYVENAERFKRFLASCDSTVDAVYILGDLFEAWIGDDDLTQFHQNIIAAFRTATDRNLKIYIMHGNRDFLLGNAFQKVTGCKFLPEEKLINLYGKSILLMHGDTLCTNDHAYMKSRRIMHSRLLQFIFLHLPLTFRRNLASKIRAKSMDHYQVATPEMMDVAEDSVNQVMQKHSASWLIHGHTHKQAIHQQEKYTRIVLPSWDHHPQVLEWNEDGTYKWVDC